MKGRVSRSQEGWSLRRIAKAIGTAALYASGQALSGTQQAMVEFGGQSGSAIAPFLLGTTVLTLPSYVGGEHLSWKEVQETLAPPAYGEDQATPASSAPALRGTVPPTPPATVTIDEEGRLECSLPVTHSSTEGTVLLEVGGGLKPGEDKLLDAAAQAYLQADRNRRGEITKEINRRKLSADAQKYWADFLRSCRRVDHGSGAGAAAAAADSDEGGAGDNGGMDEEESIAEVFNRRTKGGDTLPAMVYWKGTTAFCLQEAGVNPLYLREPLIYTPDLRDALAKRTAEIRRRKTTDPRKPAGTNVAIGSLRLFYKGDDHAWSPLHRESVITSNSFVVIDNPAALPPAILTGGFFKSGWRQQKIDGILVDATPQSTLVGQYAYSAISDIGDENSDRNKKISINEYMRFLKNRADLFFPSELTAVQRNVLSDFYLGYDYNPQAVEFSFNRLPQGIEAGTTAILGQKGGCINVDYISKYLKGLATNTAQDYFHTEQAIIKRLEEDSQRCLDAREAATPERPIDLRGCHLGTHLGADLIGRMHDMAAIFNLNILSYLSMCDKCAGTLFREGETGQLFLDNYRRAFGFNSLRLIMTIDALELRDNGHISFGKWETNFDGHWKDQDINAVIQEVEDDEVIAGRVRCSPGERSTVPNYLPNYALKNGPWIVHRFVEGALTGSFNTGYQTVGECPYYAAPAAAAAPAGAGGGH